MALQAFLGMRCEWCFLRLLRHSGCFPYNFFALCRAFLDPEWSNQAPLPAGTPCSTNAISSSSRNSSNSSNSSNSDDALLQPGESRCFPVNLQAVQKLHSGIVAAARAVRSDASNSAGCCILLPLVAAAYCCCLLLLAAAC